MMQASPGASDSLPRWVRFAGIPLAGILLTLLFIHLGFPYEPLVAGAFRAVAEQQDVSLRYGEVSSDLGFFGPGVEARDVLISSPGAADILIDRLSLRPAWSTTWFRGQPSLYIDARMSSGRASGAVAIGEPFGLEASLEGIDLAALPTDTYAAGLELDGSLDAEISFHYDADGALSGSAELAAAEGSIAFPGQPIAIPYDSFRSELSLGGEDGRFITIESAKLEGPMVSFSASGGVASAGEIDVRLQLSVTDPNLRPMVDGMGVRLNQKGEATAQLGGTLSHPTLR